MLVDDVKNLDPVTRYLDFIKATHQATWLSTFSSTLEDKDLERASNLTNQLKQTVLKKTFEIRERNKKVPKLDEILRDAIDNQAKAKKKRAEHKAWLKTLPLEQQLDLMSIGNSLDSVDFSLV